MINGSTKLYGILADPVHHVSAPELINEAFRKSGQDKILVPLHVDEISLKSVMLGLKKTKNFKGAVITMPHKKRIVSFLDYKSKAVEQVQACNVIKINEKGEIHGDMLDGRGFIKGIQRSNFKIRDKSVQIIGSGGAAAGIAFSLCESGIKDLYIFNRTKSKAVKLINDLKAHFPNIDINYSHNLHARIDLLINATSVGMKDTDQLPMSLDYLDQNTLVADVITRPEITISLKKALEKGCKIHTGMHMLQNQIELMIDFME